MKILNRPMFRYGGPIKEGIMDGIKEPKRGRVDGPGSYAGEAEVFANVEKGYVRPNYKAQEKADLIPNSQIINKDYLNKKFDKQYLLNDDQRIETDPSSFQFQYMTPDRYINKIDSRIRKDIMTKPEAKNYEFNKFVEEDYADKIQKQKSIFEQAGDPRLNKVYGNERLVGTSGAPGGGDAEMYAKPTTVAKTVEEVIENKGGTENPEDKRKKSINGILEKLGYARSQKNALYDALIKGGRRIATEGLGREGLVNDLIQDTSTSYDKPEKIREAAELMQIQQDLKLEQIDAGRTNQTEEAVNYLMSKDGGGMSRTEALDQVLKNPRSGLEAFQTAFKNLGSGSEGKAMDSAIEWSVSRDKFTQPLGKINAKKYDKPSKFAASKDFKGAGNYVLNGTIVAIDDNGSFEIKETFYTTTKSNKFLGIFGTKD